VFDPGLGETEVGEIVSEMVMASPTLLGDVAPANVGCQGLLRGGLLVPCPLARILVRVLTLVIPIILTLAGCGGTTGGGATPSAPTPAPASTPPPTYTVSGVVTETAPVYRPLAGLRVAVSDGPNRWTSAETDARGAYLLTGVAGGSHTVSASGEKYLESAKAVVISGNMSLDFQLDPVAETLVSSRDESIAPDDNCNALPEEKVVACRKWGIAVHYDGTVSATLTWTDPDTWLWLEFMRESDRVLLARSESPRSSGLRQSFSTSVSNHTYYLIRVRWVSGTRVTPFTLTITRPS
jgi:hypothetical protein